jgi:FkbM family methyltransferase
MSFYSETVINIKLLGQSGISRLKHRLLGKRVRALLVESRNGLLLVGVEDRNVAVPLASRGEYGWREVKRAQSFLHEFSELLIVGAHIGSIAIPLAKQCKAVIAVEANPLSYELLKFNLLINGSSNVTAINIAASDKEESLSFLANRVNSGGSKRVPQISKYAYVSDAPATITVPAAPLDTVLWDRTPSVIFMDIEGSEYFAVKGMQRLLAGAETFFMEFLPHHLRNVSCVSVSELLAYIKPHFSFLQIPSKGLNIHIAEGESVLQQMYDADEGDEGIIFTK